MSCGNKNKGCGCNRHGGIETKPPCNCEQHEKCEGFECSEIINAECVQIKKDGYQFSIDGGRTYRDFISLMEYIISVNSNKFVILEVNESWQDLH